MSLAWVSVVEAARARGSFDEAMTVLRDELSQRPNDALVHYQIAWTHDALGKERDAAPAYERALALGLAEPELEGALLGLGSTYRCLGEYAKSLAVFERAIKLYPENRAFRVFKSLCDYNVGHADVAIRALLTELVETTNSEDIKQYGRALLFYSDKLDQKFE